MNQNKGNQKKNNNETIVRSISGLSLGSVFIFSFNIDHFYFTYGFYLYLFMLPVILLTLYEFFQLDQSKYLHSSNITMSLIFTILIITLFYLKLLEEYVEQGHFLYPFILDILNWIGDPIHGVILILFLSLYAHCFLKIFQGKVQGALHLNAMILLGMTYIVLGASHVFLIAGMENGIFYIWFVSIGTIGADTMAYFSGKYLGRNKVNLSVSPNKTYEGYIGGLFGQLMIMYIFYYLSQQFSRMPEMSFLKITFFSVMLFVMTILGDLTGSLLKRDAQVKDSGNLMPGHGGLLDTFDALIFTMPAFYYFHKLVTNVS